MRRTRERYADAVRSVGEKLDGTRPDWVSRMPTDLSRLEMTNRNRCVLGFVYGDFAPGRTLLIRDAGRLSRFERRCLNPPLWRAESVADLWRAEVRRRRSEQDARPWPEAGEVLR